ncbi:Leucine-rich repeat, ribonuclease inhibitor subtype [Metarhizium album ARSEF 1941]|uniref:Leucine-rich repeat, ribonuclease inhibitor subtype n=1 Tax=Metarhizium album (strain ARSEF 1941) TaxID=1081103 RepID=A0A0B2WQS0_METAS|nr:Leucine-rich repeat, ribonuclease inhibitor subtype [Metarhizium album ARSEF 1941]KHN96358.1 Leucine-rich repeat, ribonuclease inhibitor subtype [Metarhizium album ARSEF 1941]
MEQVHGVDVSWMTKASPKDKANKPSTSPPKASSSAPAQPRNVPTPSQDARNPQGTPVAKGTGTPLQQNGQPTPSPTNSTAASKRTSRSGSIDNKSGPNGPPLQRRNSWFSNIIPAKFSSSATSPPSNTAAHHHSLHHLHHKESQQQTEYQASPSPAPPQSSHTSPSSDDTLESIPLPPKLNPTRNAVLQHAAAKPEGNSPYTPAPPKTSQAGFLGVFRRLSSSGSTSMVNGKLGNGLVERKVLNIDQNRERCNISELKDAKLRRVSFCVDVEIAPMPKYADGETRGAKPLDKAQKKKLTEQGEGAALKNPQAVEANKEAEEAARRTNGNGSSKPDTNHPNNEGRTHDGAADETPSAEPEKGKEVSKKKEKKKRSEEERKARKEKRRKLAEDNGSVPIEIHYDSTDSSSSDTHSGDTTPKSSSDPTTNPARIYRRCCQLRETPILKKITEQLMDKANSNFSAGTVNKLDLTDYFLQLPDLITLGDYLAVVPVKEVVLENCGLGDEGLRVILAGLLAAKMPPTSRRKKPKHELEARGGVVERLVIKNNKLGPDGWKHISLFIYKCRSLKYLDISHIAFPRQAPAVKNGNLPNGVHIPRSISDVFSKAMADRLGGSTLEMVNMGETEPSMEQLGTIMDGIIKCGVRRLGLAHNSLDADGIKHVVRYLSGGFCEGLDLGGNDINEHIETLAGCLDEHHPIWALSLSSCSLTPSSLGKLLPVIAKLRGFRFIDLSHNQELFQTEPSALGLLRRYLPKLEDLKRIHLQDVNMSPEQAIALLEVLPEARNLAHINLVGNSDLVRLADAKTEEAQEEACALYASLMAAARISRSLICVDIEVPSRESGEVVKAMAKQVVAYCLRNMERIPDTSISTIAASAMSESQSELRDAKIAAYPDVIAHLVGHDVLEQDGAEEEREDAPDEDYVIGGTGVVKALAFCLKNRGDDSQRQSAELGRSREDGSDSGALPGLATGGKAKDMSKHLLAGARKIRQRLQPALHKARAEPGDEVNLRKLTFLDETLQGIIKRFEDEFPDTREALPDAVASSELRKASWTLSEEPLQAGPTAEDSAVAVSDGEEEAEMQAPKPLSRSNSMLSRELAEEEGRMLRAGHRFRSGFVGKEQFDLISTIDDIGSDPKHCQMLVDLAEDIGGEFLEKVKEKGAVRAFKEDKDALFGSMRDSDPEHWGRFVEAQQKARANITVPSEKHGAEGRQLADENAIAD